MSFDFTGIFEHIFELVLSAQKPECNRLLQGLYNMGYSVYPGKIDGSTQLPPTIDNVTPVKAEVTNRLRDAILAVESELGVDPSGTYGTVRARLDAMTWLLNWLIKKVKELSGGGQVGGTPTSHDKELSPLATVGDEAPTGITISQTPVGTHRYVTVTVNGISNILGNGVKTKDCYFSRNGGVTPRAISKIKAGDQLIWNSTISNIHLAPTDIIDLDYDV